MAIVNNVKAFGTFTLSFVTVIVYSVSIRVFVNQPFSVYIPERGVVELRFSRGLR